MPRLATRSLYGPAEQLKALFPQAVVDGHIDIEALRRLLGDAALPAHHEHYGLQWHGKQHARLLADTAPITRVCPCRDESLHWNSTRHVLMEGDNLEALKHLHQRYAGQVKLIYIDPPYNTGNDFVYTDKYDETRANYRSYVGNTETAGRFHTQWLNMMYPRLLLAHKLLRNDGLLLMSIDDHEVAHARLLCAEIFGRDNFVDCMIWKKRYGGGAKEKHLVSLHEYILVYAKNINALPAIDVPLPAASITRYYKHRDEHAATRGPYRIHPLEAMKSFEDRRNLCFAIPAPDGTQLLPKRQWRWGPKRMQEALRRGEVAFSRNKHGAWVASSKQYLHDAHGGVRSGKVFSIIDGIYSQAGTTETAAMFGDARVFSYPKPTQLLIKLIELATRKDPDALIVDFFAGSGTTGHAVYAYNAATQGQRRFILVQAPQPFDPHNKNHRAAIALCDQLAKPRTLVELTKERLRRASQQFHPVPRAPGDVGFRVFRLR